MNSLVKSVSVVALSIGMAMAAHAQELNIGMRVASAGPLDPHISTATGDKVAFAMMFNGLVRFKPGSMNPADIEPDLAESWNVSDDGLTWTFKLRDGVQFHGDYGTLTAKDVVYSLKRAANPDLSSVSSDYTAFETITAVDDLTVEIKLSKAIPSMLGVLANYHGGNIVSAKAVAELGENFKTRPIGTGPFAFAELADGEFLRLVSHTDYFRGAPQIDTIMYRYITSGSARDLAFANGELDLFYGTREERWVERMRDDGNVIDVFEPGELRTLHLNTAMPPLDDIRVRQAVAHAINREELVAFTGASVARATTAPVPQGYLGHAEKIEGLPHDIDRAKALLAEAGYPDGVSFKVAITQATALNTAMQVIQAQLAKAGINVELDVMEHRSWHGAIRDDVSPMVLYGAARFPIADSYLTQFYHSASTVKTPTAVTNFSHCAVADAEIEAARSETDAAKQIELWQAAQEKIVSEVCSVPLFELLQVWGKSPKLDYGYELNGVISTGPLIDETTMLSD
ncbi:ABC transporter substrate-binding protein [Phaeobacter sp. J2-8]|uniref:ABC transporter substrate-binding protein n=1 Tax=Phaeobacter sp. J2-8 TaxID=2931394 RepID=UPI001FD5E1E5|nr:ABC transporter substrate-binding protein [Phaeobacter sp. J2-8]MCJ7871187.1 ABC transporter substrate-binding protein [Phaeobacter sp. J2-8]